jgi:uncharacterized membrane protein
VRALVPPLVAYLAAKGIIPAGSLDAILAAGTAIVAAVWSIINNRTGKVIGS